MKKFLTLLITIAMCFSVSACNNSSKEKMLKNAKVVSCDDISKDTNNNRANAKEKYCGQTIKITSDISDIGKNYFYLHCGKYVGGAKIKVYIDKDILLNLESRQVVTIVGKLGNDIKKEKTLSFGGEYEEDVYTMKNTQLVEDKYDITGTLIWNKSKQCYSISNDDDRYEINTDDGIDLSSLEYEECTLNGKLSYHSTDFGTTTYKMTDVTIKN